jgi:SAM-dependent methyltransferase
MTNNNERRIQADQYVFPYHYIPDVENKSLFFSRHWGFATSYMAALGLVADRLFPIAKDASSNWRHIDIGCGDGALLRYLSFQQGLTECQIAGVDIDKRAIEWARMFNPRADLHEVDMALLNGGYHSASLIEVLEHVPPDMLPTFIESAAKLLRPGGLMVVTVPSEEKNIADKHYQHFSFEHISSLLEHQLDGLEVWGFEREDWLTRLIYALRMNPLVRIDAPILNRIALNRLRRLHIQQMGCGRIFVTGHRKIV